MINTIDSRLTSSCFILADWPLSRVFLKNNADYPWFILVPRRPDIQDIDQLPQALQHTLMDEISKLSSLVKAHVQPHKINIATLGNIVPQLHVHVVARFTHDKLWPHGIWQDAQTTTPYPADTLQVQLTTLRAAFSGE